MTDELKRLFKTFTQATSPEEVFGSILGDDGAKRNENLARRYHEISKTLRDSAVSDNAAQRLAEDLLRELAFLYERAQERVEKNLYGAQPGNADSAAEPAAFTVRTGKRLYSITSALATGDIAAVYEGCVAGSDGPEGKIVAKIATDSGDNHLLENEARVLRIFQSDPGLQHKHLPVLLDQFKTSGNTLGNIFRRLDGYDLRAVRENPRWKNGVPPKHMVWMFSRLLSALGYAHSKGVIHGNIEPANIMIRPGDHNAWLIDWSFAALDPSRTGDAFKIANEEFSPPEAGERKTPLTSSDLYSLGKCMVYILGGNPSTGEIPLTTEKPLERFIRFFIRESRFQRARDAWEMHGELRKLVVELWGPRTFLEFPMDGQETEQR